MASGSYYAKKDDAHGPATTQIPRRATRHLPEAEDEERTEIIKAPPAVAPGRWGRPGRVIDEYEEHPLTRHIPWLRPLLICTVVGVVALLVLISAGVMQRPSAPQLLTSSSGQVYPIQVGGTLGTINAWTNSNGPSTPTVRIPQHLGPYSVVRKNSLSVAFMNRVLAYYHSPAAGMAQYLYNDGAKYGLDSAYALAFFMHESSFGTTGVARVTLSLSNMRCVPEYPCYNYNGGYAQFSSWEQGFEAWFKLIRNLYVNIWGRATIDQIIPKYAPNSDGNDEAAYIASLKHTIDVWRAGIISI
jgi:Mannosyl-glycoprotein endo-beta-N-acetylglucosaminidase